MLYIFQTICFSIWFFWVIRRGKYSWHAILNTYFICLLVVDTPEVIFFHFYRLYTFPTHLLSNPNADYQLGLIFSDGIILPLTGIIFCHYAVQTKHLWRLSFGFTLLQGTLEFIYLGLGYLHYNNWSHWLSLAFYFIGFRIAAGYASRIMKYNPPVPYSLRIAASVYASTVWFGAVLGGVLLNLYEWRPGLFKLPSAEDRFPDVGISWVLALFSAMIIPRIPLRYRPIVFIVFAALTTSFCYFAYGHGWLIYHRWNHFLTALRWFVPIIIVIWFDRWESVRAKS